VFEGGVDEDVAACLVALTFVLQNDGSMIMIMNKVFSCF
jgi:hypothetical protein